MFPNVVLLMIVKVLICRIEHLNICININVYIDIVYICVPGEIYQWYPWYVLYIFL